MSAVLSAGVPSKMCPDPTRTHDGVSQACRAHGDGQRPCSRKNATRCALSILPQKEIAPYPLRSVPAVQSRQPSGAATARERNLLTNSTLNIGASYLVRRAFKRQQIERIAAAKSAKAMLTSAAPLGSSGSDADVSTRAARRRRRGREGRARGGVSYRPPTHLCPERPVEEPLIADVVTGGSPPRARAFVDAAFSRATFECGAGGADAKEEGEGESHGFPFGGPAYFASTFNTARTAVICAIAAFDVASAAMTRFSRTVVFSARVFVASATLLSKNKPRFFFAFSINTSASRSFMARCTLSRTPRW